MKIVKLVAENVKRLHAISITPDGALVTIGGKNGAGKSSVLDSIAYAMGGEKLVPSEPIRTGESDAKIIVDMGDLVVTRKFHRDEIVDKDALGADGKPMTPPKFVGWGDTKSTLTVTNKDGAKYPSPQAVLDKLLGRLTFDPLQFARDDPKRQDEVLRKLVGIDVTLLEAKRKEAFDKRAMLKKTYAIKDAQAQALPKHAGVPAEEVSIAEVSKEMLQAEEYRKLAEDAEREVQKTQSNGEQLERQRVTLATAVDRLTEQLKEKNDELARSLKDAENNRRELDAKQITAEAARAVVPDVAVIRQKLTDAEATNAKVRANGKRADAEAEVAELVAKIHHEDMLVGGAEEAKLKALREAKFPVDGLGLNDDGVTFNGLPFAQAGSAEQVRVSVAIGIALNPQLKVLLIRNGNLLDHDSLKTVAAQAEAADMQVWMEYVSETKDGVAVMMVDGEVA